MSINNLSLNCPAETEVCQLKNKYDEVYSKYKSVKYGENYKKLGKSIEIKNLQQMNSKDRVDAIVEKESGAIMIYLAEKSGKLISSDPTKKAKVLEWLMFQMGGVGPMMGQANVFFRYFPEKIQPAIDRYQNEGRRLFEVLDTHLKDNEWLAGEFSIADIANWCWVRTYKWSGINVDGLDHLDRWIKAMYEQPGMVKGIEVPIKIESMLDDDEKAKEFAKNAEKMVKK